MFDSLYEIPLSEIFPPKFSDLKGKIIVEISGLKPESEEIYFKTSDGKQYIMYGDEPKCCAHVSVDDVIGDVEDLLNTPILQAEVSTRHSREDEDDSYTWTFYKLATIKGYVTIKWYGSSNGYYSEEVSFKEYEEEY